MVEEIGFWSLAPFLLLTQSTGMCWQAVWVISWPVCNDDKELDQHQQCHCWSLEILVPPLSCQSCVSYWMAPVKQNQTQKRLTRFKSKMIGVAFSIDYEHMLKQAERRLTSSARSCCLSWQIKRKEGKERTKGKIYSRCTVNTYFSSIKALLKNISLRQGQLFITKL